MIIGMDSNFVNKKTYFIDMINYLKIDVLQYLG